MPSTPAQYALVAVRLLLVVGGLVFTVGSLHALFTIPPAPPGDEGLVTGMAYLVGGFILMVSLGVTGLGFTLPALLGAEDSLGFDGYQTWILRAGGVVLVGGFLVGAVVSLALQVEAGVILWFGTIVLGVFAVVVAVVWRLGEVAHGRLVEN